MECEDDDAEYEAILVRGLEEFERGLGAAAQAQPPATGQPSAPGQPPAPGPAAGPQHPCPEPEMSSPSPCPLVACTISPGHVAPSSSSILEQPPRVGIHASSPIPGSYSGVSISASRLNRLERPPSPDSSSPSIRLEPPPQASMLVPSLSSITCRAQPAAAAATAPEAPLHCGTTHGAGDELERERNQRGVGAWGGGQEELARREEGPGVTKRAWSFGGGHEAPEVAIGEEPGVAKRACNIGSGQHEALQEVVGDAEEGPGVAKRACNIGHGYQVDQRSNAPSASAIVPGHQVDQPSHAPSALAISGGHQLDHTSRAPSATAISPGHQLDHQRACTHGRSPMDMTRRAPMDMARSMPACTHGACTHGHDDVGATGAGPGPLPGVPTPSTSDHRLAIASGMVVPTDTSAAAAAAVKGGGAAAVAIGGGSALFSLPVQHTNKSRPSQH